MSSQHYVANQSQLKSVHRVGYIIPKSECMKGSVTTRSDIRMQPRLSILYIHKYYMGQIKAGVFKL